MGELAPKLLELSRHTERDICVSCDNYTHPATDPATRAKRIQTCMACQWPLLFAQISERPH